MHEPTPDPTRVEQTFAEALGKSTPSERAAFLDIACADAPGLRARVEQLIAAHADRANALPLPTLPPEPSAETVGRKIGRYKLLEQIGEGGFGVVFMAEQTSPVHRRVALKVIKLGMDTKQVVARFEAERQALAMMDHPHVAHVYDAGATDAGRPYFVMELVKGVPITEFCDRHNLAIAERLSLFTQVCQAVQHAHQKGIIHRDLKPTNVLVATADDRPVAKVIDFGVAKATQARLTERTLFTEFRQWVGTPQYMSPEQADGAMDIDTRSDVYALGVLLYELLTGTTPFEARELRAKGYAEIQRIICEVEPPKPSTRLSTMKDALPSVAATRHTEPRRLQSVVRGELDWIVMKCLEKDRTRRYESASALCADLGHYLEDEPVSAAAPSRAYRLRTFARRNRRAIAAVSLIMLSLAAGIVVSVRQAVRATRAERQAIENERRAVSSARQAEAVSDFLVAAFRSPDPDRQARSITIAEVLERSRRDLDGKFGDDPLTKAAMLHAIASAFTNLGLSGDAIAPFEEALRLRRQALGERHADTLSTMSALASAYWISRRALDAVPMAETALRLRRETLGERHPDTVRSMLVLAHAYGVAGRDAEAMSLARQTLELYRTTFGDDSHETLDGMNQVGAILGNARDPGGAPLFERSADRLRATLGIDHPDTLLAVYNLGLHYWNNARRDDAISLWTEVITRGQVVLGPEHPLVRKTIAALASGYRDMGIVDPAQFRALQSETTRPTTAPSLLVTRAQIRAALGDLDGATEDLVGVIPHLDDRPWTFSPRKNACRVAAAIPALFERVARVLPDETALWVSRADLHALREQWVEARRDYERVIHDRGLQDECFAYGGVLLLSGDEAAYEAFCRATVERFGDPDDEYAKYVLATLCVMGPAKSVDPQRVLRWATAAANRREAWRLETFGMALLYAGEPGRAEQAFEDAGQLWKNDEYRFGSALAQHAQGHSDAARESLRKAKHMLDRFKPPGPGRPALISPPSRWIQLRLYVAQADREMTLPTTSSAAPHP